MILFATLFSTAVWFLGCKLVLNTFNRPTTSVVRTYLVVSTMAVAMTTFFAVVLAVAAIE